MDAFILSMDNPAGRVLRVAVGVALVVWGFGSSGPSPAGVVLGLIGFVPIVMGVWGRCLPELFRR